MLHSFVQFYVFKLATLCFRNSVLISYNFNTHIIIDYYLPWKLEKK